VGQGAHGAKTCARVSFSAGCQSKLAPVRAWTKLPGKGLPRRSGTFAANPVNMQSVGPERDTNKDKNVGTARLAGGSAVLRRFVAGAQANWDRVFLFRTEGKHFPDLETWSSIGEMG